jgi:Fe2+ or Zn2+ uptake regulation protein
LPGAAWQAEVMRDLRESGLKLTSPRKALLACIANAETPLTAEDIAARLATAQGHGGRSTTYRLLHWLATRGWLTRIYSEGGECMALARQLPGHHLAVCTSCGVTFPVGGWNLDAMVTAGALPTSFTFEQLVLQLRGRCGECVPHEEQAAPALPRRGK